MQHQVPSNKAIKTLHQHTQKSGDCTDLYLGDIGANRNNKTKGSAHVELVMLVTINFETVTISLLHMKT